MNGVLLALLLAWSLPCNAAGGVGTEAQERARITAERAAAQSAFGSRERECQNSFVVTPCVETARRDLREVMLRLRRQEAVLDEMQRRERAAQRMEVLRNRPAAAPVPAEAASAVGGVEAVSPAAPLASEKKRAAPREPKTPNARAHAAKTPKVSAAERQRAEELSEQKFKAASQAASARRVAVERRNAERAAGKKPAASLPVPAGASAP